MEQANKAQSDALDKLLPKFEQLIKENDKSDDKSQIMSTYAKLMEVTVRLATKASTQTTINLLKNLQLVEIEDND